MLGFLLNLFSFIFPLLRFVPSVLTMFLVALLAIPASAESHDSHGSRRSTVTYHRTGAWGGYALAVRARPIRYYGSTGRAAVFLSYRPVRTRTVERTVSYGSRGGVAVNFGYRTPVRSILSFFGGRRGIICAE